MPIEYKNVQRHPKKKHRPFMPVQKTNLFIKRGSIS